ncbi:MAG: hypothetical protein ACYTHK_17970 [Planctomycetota bacterium]|jgi:hypothetical protein
MQWKVIGLSVCLFALAASAQDREIEELEREMEELSEKIELLEKLAAGMEALEALGRERELEMMERVVRELTVHARGRTERQIAERQLEALRFAFDAFEGRKEERFVAMREALEHGIHARELLLEGERGEYARKVIRTQPKAAHLIEILMVARDELREQGKAERAMFVHRVATEWREGHKRKQERVKANMHALEVAYESLAGLDDERNRKIRGMLGERIKQLRGGKEWNREQTAQVLEILHYCEERLREQKKHDAADIVHRYREPLLARWRESRPEANLERRVARLERKVDRMAELLERILHELEADEDDD